MRTRNNSTNFKSIIFTLSLVFLFSATSILGFETENHTFSYKNLNNIVAEQLKVRLQEDLFEDNLVVKLKTIKEQRVSDNKVEMEGKAVYVFTRNKVKVPINYEVKVNIRERKVTDISYDFVEVKPRSAFAPTAVEDTLMDVLLKQINTDLKTEDIVIALVDEEDLVKSKDGKKFIGRGEVKIDNQGWKKIEFEVELNSKKNKPQKVIYKVK